MESCDIEIRSAIHKKLLHSHHSCPNTYVINELGVAHGKQRIDIAVINGSIHGYEIKSSKDNLKRLPKQLEAFGNCFEKLSIVSAPNHLEHVMDLSPEWCGVIVAEKGKRGGIHFSQVRRGKKNPEINLTAVLHFLWKKEAQALLACLADDSVAKYSSRAELYKEISKIATYEEIFSWIKESFKERRDWLIDGQL